MNTLKSAALIIVLMGVLWGVYAALNQPDARQGLTGHEQQDLGPPMVEFDAAPSAIAPATAATAPALVPSQDVESSASPATTRPSRGGAFQPTLDTTSLPPPTSVPGLDVPPTSPPGPPADGHGGAGDARASVEKSDEAPAGTLADSPGSSVGSSSQNLTPESSNAASTAAASSSSPAIAAWSLRRDWQEAEQLVNEGKLKAALAKLSPHYLSPEVPSDQRTPLAAWLDALAAKVIYSREHLLAAPHHVRKGETLFEIADQYNVPWRLLANINSHAVSDPRVLVQGTELKVVPGPFRAHVNLATSELTLYVSDLYAGRFPLSIGDQPPSAGQYKVVDKMSQQKTYYGLDGRVIPANEPSNPYGGWWISLGGDVSIHGSPATPETQKLGCISLSPQDAKDVYGILSMGSDVTIQR